MIIKEFNREVYEKGIREEGREEVNRLNQLLVEAGRMDDLVRATSDQKYQEQLLKEFMV